jgi:hypothetical protein
MTNIDELINSILDDEELVNEAVNKLVTLARSQKAGCCGKCKPGEICSCDPVHGGSWCSEHDQDIPPESQKVGRTRK